MSTVYIVHEPTRYDFTQRCVVPTDYSAAREYGAFQVIFPGVGALVPRGEVLHTKLVDNLALFGHEDFLLMAGDMELIVLAAIKIYDMRKIYPKLLKWNNRRQRYEPAL